MHLGEKVCDRKMAAGVSLRDVIEEDLFKFFEFQLDPEANRMAAFTAKYPFDRDAFMRHWRKIMDDEEITIKTVLFDGQVAGSIVPRPGKMWVWEDRRG
jgi:hypothetical protein